MLHPEECTTFIAVGKATPEGKDVYSRIEKKEAVMNSVVQTHLTQTRG